MKAKRLRNLPLRNLLKQAKWSIAIGIYAGPDLLHLGGPEGITNPVLTADDVTALGQRILKVERAFNAAAGFTAKDDRLPRFFQTEPLPPHNVVFDVPDAELDSVHSA